MVALQQTWDTRYSQVVAKLGHPSSLCFEQNYIKWKPEVCELGGQLLHQPLGLVQLRKWLYTPFQICMSESVSQMLVQFR